MDRNRRALWRGLLFYSFSRNNHGPFFTLSAGLPGSGDRKVHKRNISCHHGAYLGENKNEVRSMDYRAKNNRALETSDFLSQLES